MKQTGKNGILCFGEVLWDMLPGGKKPGGAPLNVAIHLKKQGLDPHLVSRIGRDASGDELLDYLSAREMNIRFVEKDDLLPTSEVKVHLDDDKNATYEICAPVAWDNIRVTPELEAAAANTGTIIFGTLASRSLTSRQTLLHLLQLSEATRVLDVNLRPPYDTREVVEKLLNLAGFVKLNDEELIRIAGWNNQQGDEKTLMKWFSGFYRCSTLCVTRGANGAALLTGGTITDHPGFQVNAVDTVGAGDSFLAALVARLSAGSDPQNALDYASAVGALVASRNGAVPDYAPNEVEAFFNREIYD